ncbi:A/G-specific adenine glycosylase [Ramlibacter tataouinensis]|uniref:A/G-specific adenine glycosylase n=1 Tax=Ramlibacter tataouinensis TaxID=94132 RepID=UPI0022F3F7C3|nr:A/G-specific adenine glycosylase [Ramlibacter tataouinensis]WBY00509.1 A/G-specific adenine glycosylase [Ramlibacter tataouinensis]
MTAQPRDFAGRVVRWQRQHGRQALPWQGTQDPYRVWLSEVMLQQTQVATVLAYYPRFLQRFPDVAALAAADLDEVLGLWSGLGYYSRARNLHRCAQVVVGEHGGRFPASAASLEQLPGIGRSTAAAIAAFCWNERAAILDGNVKRVLARVLAFGEDLSQAAAVNALWARAGELLPASGGDMPAYTQGLMDLGATVCLARKPSCLICPLEAMCAARREQAPERYPVRSRRTRRSSQALWLLQARARDGSVWLEKRPVPGVWAGLYCLPVFDSREALAEALPATARRRLDDRPAFLHVLTHRDLHLHPVVVDLPSAALRGREGAWFAGEEWPSLGLPAPVRSLLSQG